MEVGGYSYVDGRIRRVVYLYGVVYWFEVEVYVCSGEEYVYFYDFGRCLRFYEFCELRFLLDFSVVGCEIELSQTLFEV